MARELGTGFDPKLAERLAQVVVDRARADEQLSGDLPIRCALCREATDLCFLRGQLVARLRGPLAGALAGGLELDPRALGESLRTERGEQLVGTAQVLPRVLVGDAPGAAIRRRADGRGRRRGEGGCARAPRSPGHRSSPRPPRCSAAHASGSRCRAPSRSRRRQWSPRAARGRPPRPRPARSGWPPRSTRPIPKWRTTPRVSPRRPAGPRPARRHSGRGCYPEPRSPTVRRSVPLPRLVAPPPPWRPRSARRPPPRGHGMRQTPARRRARCCFR